MFSMMFSVIGLADVVWGIVEVAFENNNTTALESFNSYQIFITDDMIKKLKGFKLLMLLQILKMKI